MKSIKEKKRFNLKNKINAISLIGLIVILSFVSLTEIEKNFTKILDNEKNEEIIKMQSDIEKENNNISKFSRLFLEQKDFNKNNKGFDLIYKYKYENSKNIAYDASTILFNYTMIFDESKNIIKIYDIEYKSKKDENIRFDYTAPRFYIIPPENANNFFMTFDIATKKFNDLNFKNNNFLDEKKYTKKYERLKNNVLTVVYISYLYALAIIILVTCSGRKDYYRSTKKSFLKFLNYNKLNYNFKNRIEKTKSIKTKKTRKNENISSYLIELSKEKENIKNKEIKKIEIMVEND